MLLLRLLKIVAAVGQAAESTDSVLESVEIAGPTDEAAGDAETVAAGETVTVAEAVVDAAIAAETVVDIAVVATVGEDAGETAIVAEVAIITGNDVLGVERPRTVHHRFDQHGALPCLLLIVTRRSLEATCIIAPGSVSKASAFRYKHHMVFLGKQSSKITNSANDTDRCFAEIGLAVVTGAGATVVGAAVAETSVAEAAVRGTC
ncbi:Hypothetical predicted protein [Paramuricea clavata]|uniref:Uncharacterized protein n=1 Tax=Paramuricea clavata TaxID=317549 RepID=A0A6S7KUK5_PARCT|nr:Hypothetical predicted protein [Paramuricea clavata]